MMARESIPSKKTTNGGNGSYMLRKPVKDVKRGDKKMSPNMLDGQTATGKAVLKAM